MSTTVHCVSSENGSLKVFTAAKLVEYLATMEQEVPEHLWRIWKPHIASQQDMNRLSRQPSADHQPRHIHDPVSGIGTEFFAVVEA